MIVCVTVTEIPADVQEFATRLFDMARNGDATLLDYVDQGVAVDMTNQDGNSFLMLASYGGHAELVKGLIERGADVNKLNDRGQSPLAGVVFKKRTRLSTSSSTPAPTPPPALPIRSPRRKCSGATTSWRR